MMTRNAQTDPDTGLRFYTWEGKDYPSVTSIRRLVGMPFTLHNWVLSQVVDRAVFESPELVKMLTRDKRPRERALIQNRIKEAKAWLRSAATEERDKAGDRGTRAHEAIAADLPLEACDDEVRPYVRQWQDFVETTEAQTIWAERQVWNLTHGYAGTADRLIFIPDWNGRPRRLLTDLKTSKGIYLDHALQVIAYSLGDFVGEDDVVDEVATQQLHAADGMAILHLQPDEWELVEIRASDVLFSAFVASLIFANFLWANDNVVDNLIADRWIGMAPIPVKEAQT